MNDSVGETLPDHLLVDRYGIVSCKECGTHYCGYVECCPDGLTHMPACSHAAMTKAGAK